METYTQRGTVPYPLETVLAWHRRPGALTRLTPHWAGSITRDDAVAEDVVASGKLSILGSRGVASVPWKSEILETSETGFTDVMVQGPFTKWKHAHDLLETANDTVLRDVLEIQTLTDEAQKKLGPAQNFASTTEKKVLSKQLDKFFEARRQRLEADLGFWKRYANVEPQTVVIAGASGMVGTQVAALLTSGGHTVRTLVRREPQNPNEYRWNPESGVVDTAAFEGADAVIHLGGSSISTRFTEKNKKKILDSRVNSTRLLANALANKPAESNKWPDTFVVASAIGIYGSLRPGEELREDSALGDDFLADVCKQWESAADTAREADLRVVHVRTGLVYSALGGSLKLQLPLFLAGAGAWIGKGDQVQSWISLDDIAGIYVHAVLTDELEGAVNAVAPAPVTAKMLAKETGRALRRPVLVPAPKQAAALLLGKDGAEQLALADQTVSPAKVLSSGYVFFETDLATALKHELG